MCLAKGVLPGWRGEGPSSGDLGIQYWQGLVPVGWGKERAETPRVNRRSLTYVPERRTVLLTEIGRRGRGSEER